MTEIVPWPRAKPMAAVSAPGDPAASMTPSAPRPPVASAIAAAASSGATATAPSRAASSRRAGMPSTAMTVRATRVANRMAIRPTVPQPTTTATSPSARSARRTPE